MRTYVLWWWSYVDPLYLLFHQRWWVLNPDYPTPFAERRRMLNGTYVIEHVVATDFGIPNKWVITGQASTPERAHTKSVKWWQTKQSRKRQWKIHLMPDISMCPGGECPMKHSCYRYTATPTPHWQSYFTKPPFTISEGVLSCDYYDQIETTPSKSTTAMPLRKEQWCL